MSRKRFNEKDVIETLAWQGWFVSCFRCARPFLEQVVQSGTSGMFKWNAIPEREHIHEIALGGDDAPNNCRYSCKECHAVVTNGTKATSAGSSKHKIAKVRRLRGETKGRPKKKWAAGRKIPARQFQKRPKSD